MSIVTILRPYGCALSMSPVTLLAMVMTVAFAADPLASGETAISVTATKVVVTVTEPHFNFPSFNPLPCESFGTDTTPTELIAQSPVVFLGRAIATRAAITHFEVKEDFKGGLPHAIDITYPDPSPCAPDVVFNDGDDYFIIAYPEEPGSDGTTKVTLQQYTSIPDHTGLLAAARRYRSTRRRLDAATAAHPHDAHALVELARYLDSVGQTDAARERYIEAIPLDRSIDALSGAARHSLCHGDIVMAYEFSSRALIRSPGSKEAKQIHDLSAVAAGRDIDLRNADLAPGAACDRRYLDTAITLDLKGRDASGLHAVGAHLDFRDTDAARLANTDFEHAELRGSLPQADFHEANLRGATITGNVSGANFNRAKASGLKMEADASGARFVDARLDGGDLSRGSYEKADFTRANLAKAKLGYADYAMADFSGANLVGADIGRSDFRGANLRTAKFSAKQVGQVIYDCTTMWPSGFNRQSIGAILMPGPAACPRPPHWDYSGRDLSNLSFAGEDLKGADFKGSTICGAQFAGAVLDDAIFTELQGCPFEITQFSGARLDHADLRGVDLSIAIGPEDANPEPPLLNGADLRGARVFVGQTPPTPALIARLKEADLRGAIISCDHSPDLAASLKSSGLPVLFDRGCEDRVPPSSSVTGADLAGTALRNVDLRGLDLTGGGFRQANLSRADLRGAKLQGLDLHNADLDGADLRDADLRGTDLAHATLEHADLRDADLRGAKLPHLGTYDVIWGTGTHWPEGFAPQGGCTNPPEADRPPLELATPPLELPAAAPGSFRPLPDYPTDSWAMGEEDKVILRAKVSPEGHVVESCLKAANRPLLADAALDLVTNQLRFAPFASAEPVWTEIEVDYVLK